MSKYENSILKYDEFNPYYLKKYSNSKLDVLNYCAIRKLFYKDYDYNFIVILLHTIDLFIHNICLNPNSDDYNDLNKNGRRLFIKISSNMKNFQKTLKKHITNDNIKILQNNYIKYYKRWIDLVKDIHEFIDDYKKE